ncbi:serpin-ZXA-like [Rutidosis leptorrhynchoides]|uniref:serpin-ZXA-like n=1 Tax=Rutidosis leptorrhynchoides TaxID=125765 RepID=UPI003A9A00E7
MDHTRILDSTHPGADKLYVSNILQQSFIEVDEKGTESVGYSRMALRGGGGPPVSPPVFVGDQMQVDLLNKNFASSLSNAATKVLLDDANNGFKNGNFVCSPFSLEAILGMVAAGAQGKTLKQLLEFLGHETVDQLLYESPSSKLLQQILFNTENVEAGLEIALANGIWVDSKMNRVQIFYEEVLKTVYKTEAKFLDFENKPEESAREMNSWVGKETRGLIPTIVKKTDLEEVFLVLANALYFNGLWYQPFFAHDTKEKDFHLINGKTVSVPFMTSSRYKYLYGSFNGYKIIQLPYETEGRSNKFSMYIFLPDKNDGLHDLLQVFDADNELFHTKYELRSTNFDDLWIPKFKISCNFEPKDVMKQMGLTLPFEHLNMELTRMVDSTHPDADKLYVSDILQQSFIEVNEKGTEAAAFARMRMSGGGGPHFSRPVFVADHPFMFMIREDTSRAVLFLGVVLNPKQI